MRLIDLRQEMHALGALADEQSEEARLEQQMRVNEVGAQLKNVIDRAAIIADPIDQISKTDQYDGPEFEVSGDEVNMYRSWEGEIGDHTATSKVFGRMGTFYLPLSYETIAAATDQTTAEAVVEASGGNPTEVIVTAYQRRENKYSDNRPDETYYDLHWATFILEGLSTFRSSVSPTVRRLSELLVSERTNYTDGELLTDDREAANEWPRKFYVDLPRGLYFRWDEALGVDARRELTVTFSERLSGFDVERLCCSQDW